MSVITQAVAVARHDLLAERRAQETITIVLPFGLAALVALPIAIGVDLPLIAEVGPAIYWTIGLLFGMQLAWRFTLADSGPIRDLFTLLGIQAGSRFWGRTMASAVLLTGFMVALGLAALLFYSPDLDWSWLLLPILILFATGLALISTLAAELTTGLAGRAALAALVVVPLAIPLVVAAAQAVESLARGRGILSWLLMLGAANLVLAAAGTLAAKPLEEAAK
jgi:heme exporter protein B